MTFFITLFWKQNSHHKHGVLVHTLKVTYFLIKKKQYNMIMAGLLHDIGKPFVAYQKPEDILKNEYSFTDHEEKSYQIIKNWLFISDYTKQLVRWHYLIRKRSKANKKNNIEEVEQCDNILNSFSIDFQKDLYTFLKCDDLGKK